MGSNCSGKRTVNSVNDANVTFISGDPRNFCTIAGVAGDKYRQRFCNSLGDNEFGQAGGNSQYKCQYNNGNNYEKFNGTGCCNSECPIVGRGVGCNRAFYRGNPNSCCLRDYACNGINNTTFNIGNYDSSDRDSNGNFLLQRSCPTNVRSLASTTCQNYIESLCSNLDSANPNPTWRSNWLTNKTITNTYNTIPQGGNTSGSIIWRSPVNTVCLHSLYRNVYGVNSYGCMGTAPPTIATGIQVFPTAEGMVWGRSMVQDLFNTYIKEGGNLGAGESDEGDTQMNNLIWSICSTIPGICTDSLKQFCSTITTENLIRNPNLQKWCGCYMPDFEYAKYSNLYQINKQCTPQCNQAGIIPLVDETGIQPLSCKQSTCVIDNVSIQLYEAKVGSGGSGINFSQVCGSCGGGDNTGTCQCTLTGLNFAAVQANIPSLDISQQCGAGSVCYFESTDETGNIITTPIPCSSELGYDPTLNAQQQAQTGQNQADRWRNTKILLLFLFIIIVLIVVWILLSPRGLPEETRVYARNPPKQQPSKYHASQSGVGKSISTDSDLTLISSTGGYLGSSTSSEGSFVSAETGFRSIID